MGDNDSHVGKMLIFSISFIGCFIALIALTPTEFYMTTKDYTQFEVPDYFDIGDIQHIKHFLNKTISGQTLFDFNTASNPVDHKVILCFYDSELYNCHVTWSWWIFESVDLMTWSNYGEYLSKTEALSAWNSDYNASVLSTQCSHLTIKAWLYDSNTTRNNLSAAWDAYELELALGFGYSDYETKLNAWDILGRLLTFQSPALFGFEGDLATMLNLVISLPFWCCVGYTIYRLILMAIPFLGG